MLRKHNIPLGVFFSLISFFSLSSTYALVKLIPISALQILFLQSLFCFTVIACICLIRREKPAFYVSKHYVLLFVRALGGLGTFLFIFIAVKYLSVADSTVLLNTSPFMIPFLLLLLFRSPINHKLWLPIALGFIGTVIILHPSSDIFQWHALLPLISAVSMAITYIALRKLHVHGEPMLRILFYLFLFASLVMLPFGLYVWVPPTPHQWLMLLTVMTTNFISQTTFTFSLRYGPAQTLAPLCYTSVVFAMLFDYLIWHTLPSWLSLGGSLLVICGGIFALLIENSRERLD